MITDKLHPSNTDLHHPNAQLNRPSIDYAHSPG
jgi:hypothetical protein